MDKPTVNIEIFCAPNCNRCGRAVVLVEETIQEIAQETSKDHQIDKIKYHKINIVEEIDYAVELGIRATPAIVINGKLEFTATPDKKSLKLLIQQYL